MTSPATRLAELLVQAQQEQTLLHEIPHDLTPQDRDAAYCVQDETLKLRGVEAGGWKVGSKSDTDPIRGSVLPRDCLFPTGHAFEHARYRPAGLELEIAFRFKHAFDARDEPYSNEEVMDAIGEMAAAIELVSSRFSTYPQVEPLIQLADLLNHGALVVGKFVPYRKDFDFIAPAVELTFAEENIVPAETGNPAGDPRRLLPWLVNHYTQHGQTLPKDFVVTTGSYTGMHFAKTPGELHGQIVGLPDVSLRLV
ncbi:2-keto-4-pentenoate hydratase [Pseudomonas matsuisoli]|uniref:Hydratase n=1 Tax=Pseudomonas matsuisoli TaxID=1515666 RepID=A0A917PR59_9PSED|nr:2-keto-4-pentenoate hydratase [Pseudomonas matsuisoli]GGJ88628.1 hydratase [Pseudomonas matsuisoli]